MKTMIAVSSALVFLAVGCSSNQDTKTGNRSGVSPAVSATPTSADAVALVGLPAYCKTEKVDDATLRFSCKPGDVTIVRDVAVSAAFDPAKECSVPPAPNATLVPWNDVLTCNLGGDKSFKIQFGNTPEEQFVKMAPILGVVGKVYVLKYIKADDKNLVLFNAGLDLVTANAAAIVEGNKDAELAKQAADTAKAQGIVITPAIQAKIDEYMKMLPGIRDSLRAESANPAASMASIWAKALLMLPPEVSKLVTDKVDPSLIAAAVLLSK